MTPDPLARTGVTRSDWPDDTFPGREPGREDLHDGGIDRANERLDRAVKVGK